MATTTTTQVNLTFEDLVFSWTKENAASIHEAVLLKGGWEGWAQIEIVFYIQETVPLPVLREQAVFSEKSAARADIVLMDASNKVSNVLELKCQVPNEEVASTIGRLTTDTQKLTELDNNNEIPKTAIAITTAGDSERVVENWNKTQSDLNKLVCRKVDVVGGMPIFVIVGRAADTIIFTKRPAQAVISQPTRGGDRIEGLGTNKAPRSRSSSRKRNANNELANESTKEAKKENKKS